MPDEPVTDGESAFSGSDAENLSACGCPRGADGVRWHPRDCPAVAFFDEVQRSVQPRLEEMARQRRRAYAEAAFYVIG